MKCDELQYERLGDANKTYPASTLVIRKQFVDAAIAELKEVYKDSVDVKIKIWERCKKAEDELRKTQRALWLARAMALSRFDAGEYLRKHMNSKFWNDGFHTYQEACYVMQHVIDGRIAACRKKAKEYK